MIEDGWITKLQAATRLTCDERTIERKARAGKIERRTRPGFPTLYRQADVEKLAQRGSGEVRTGVLEPITGNGNGHGGTIGTVQPSASAMQAVLVEVLQALRGLLTAGPIGPTGPTEAPTGPTQKRDRIAGDRLYLTLAEAAAWTGLSEKYLRRQCRTGSLPAVKDHGWKIKRTDLETL